MGAETDPVRQLGWTLAAVGAAIVLIGLLLAAPWPSWLGRLPGDIRIEREHVRFYFPLTTCLLVSLILTLAFWLVRFFAAR